MDQRIDKTSNKKVIESLVHKQRLENFTDKPSLRDARTHLYLVTLNFIVVNAVMRVACYVKQKEGAS